MPRMKVQSILNEIMPVLVPLLLKHSGHAGCRPIDIENAIKGWFKQSAEANDEKVLVRPHVLHGVLNELMDDDKTVDLVVRQYILAADRIKFDEKYKSRITALHTLCHAIIEFITTYIDYFEQNTDKKHG